MSSCERSIVLLFGALVVINRATAVTIWSDNFNNDSSAYYDVSKVTSTGSLPDSRAIISFDFGKAWPYDDFVGYTGTVATHWNHGSTIPESPGGSGKRALYVRINEDQLETTSVESILISPKGLDITGDYTMTVDCWYELTTSGASAQFALFGGNYRSTVPFIQEVSGPGYLFALTGDGSSTQDYRAFIGGYTQLSSAGKGGWQAPLGTGTGTQPQQNNNNSYYTSYFSSPTFFYPGSIGNAWVKLRVRRIGTRVLMGITKQGGIECLINDFESTAWVNGVPALGMYDPASSPRPVQQPQFVLFDNLVVEKVDYALVSGTLHFQDLANSNTFSMPQTVNCERWDAAGTTKISDELAIVETSGAYRVVVPQGDYLLKFDYSHWLQKSVPVNTNLGSISNVNLSFINGDCDGDNYVSTDDYALLSAHFDRYFDPSNPGNGFDPRADLDENDYIGTDDYLILSQNFDTSGD